MALTDKQKEQLANWSPPAHVKALLEGYLAIVQGRWADEDHEFVVDMLKRMSE